MSRLMIAPGIWRDDGWSRDAFSDPRGGTGGLGGNLAVPGRYKVWAKCAIDGCESLRKSSGTVCLAHAPRCVIDGCANLRQNANGRCKKHRLVRHS